MRRERRTKGEIAIPLMGGLGNQLFQFAAGLFIESTTQKKPMFMTSWGSNTLDVRSGSRDTQRKLMISDLIDDSEISTKSRIGVASLKLRSLINPAVWISETDTSDFPLERISNSTRILVGYFQRIKYVEHISNEFQNRLKQSETFSQILPLTAEPIISIHIRYGDYLHDPNTRSVHGLTAMSYYVEGARLLLAENPYNQIIIFSDEPERAFTHFVAAFGPTSIKISASNGTTELDDLRTMARSSGLVISNSSFSWWAAWIASTYVGSQIIAPKPWFSSFSGADEFLLHPSWRAIHRELHH